MKIQSVAILGAGAVGSYIIWGLSKKDNIRLGVIAEGDRARRLKERDRKSTRLNSSHNNQSRMPSSA